MNDSFAAPPRRRAKTPVTWPAFVLAALVGIAAATYYGLKVRPVRLYDEDLSYALWQAISPALVPATVGALAIWSLLYFGFVRWKNGERGPLYFNLLFPIILGTLVAIPFGDQAYRTWKDGDVKGLNLSLAKANAAGRTAEAQARTPLTAALAAAGNDVRLAPEALTASTDRRLARSRLKTAREASRNYHGGYATRAAVVRAAFQKATVDHHVSAEIAQRTMRNYDASLAMQLARNKRIQDLEQALIDEAEAGIVALDRAPWRVDGQRLLFASREAGMSFIAHHNNTAKLLRKLQSPSDGSIDLSIDDAQASPGVRISDDYN